LEKEVIFGVRDQCKLLLNKYAQIAEINVSETLVFSQVAMHCEQPIDNVAVLNSLLLTLATILDIFGIQKEELFVLLVEATKVEAFVRLGNHILTTRQSHGIRKLTFKQLEYSLLRNACGS